MKYKLIISLLSVLFFVGCEGDFLDKIPKGLIIAETTDDFRQLLDNADTRYSYNLTMVSSFVDIASDDSQMDSTFYGFDRDRLHARHLYVFDDQIWTPDGPEGDDVWKQNYYINSITSTILDEINIANDNPKIQKQLEAEARVHRAFAYLTLVNIYAKHYNESTAGLDLGVPLVMHPVDLPRLNRASVKDVYDFILNELLSAVDNLPEDVDPVYSHRPTKVSTYAVLARAYLYMGKYEKAFEYSDKSLKIRDFLYDYNNIYEDAPRPENVKGLSKTTDEEMLWLKTTCKGAGASLSTYYMLDSATFNKIYDGFRYIDDSTVENDDLRRVLWFSGFDSRGKLTAERAIYEFKTYRYSVDEATVDYIPISTPEMYLTRAEGNARLGKLTEAVEDINKLRMHRFKAGSYTPIDALGMTQDQVIDLVLDERRRELYGLELRLFDVKRLSLPVTHLNPGLMTAGFSTQANSPKLIWPIHFHYIELNGELEQNLR